MITTDYERGYELGFSMGVDKGQSDLQIALEKILTWDRIKMCEVFDNWGTIKQILHNFYAREIIKRVKAETRNEWRELATDEMTMEQLQEAVNYFREKEAADV